MKDYTVKMEMLNGYFSRLLYAEIPRYGPILNFNCMIEIVCRVMVDLCQYQLWTRNNMISKVILENWYNGHNLIHLRHGIRLRSSGELRVLQPFSDKCKKQLKTHRIFVELVSKIINDDTLDICDLGWSKPFNAQEGMKCMSTCKGKECRSMFCPKSEVPAQGFSDIVSWVMSLPRRCVTWFIKKNFKAAVREAFSSVSQTIMDVLQHVMEFLEKITMPIFTKVKTFCVENAERIKRLLTIIGLYVSLRFLTDRYAKEYASEIFSCLATVIFVDQYGLNMNEEEVKSISPPPYTPKASYEILPNPYFDDESVLLDNEEEVPAQMMPSMNLIPGLMGLTTSVLFGTFSTKYSSQFNSLMNSGFHVSRYIEFFILNFKDIVDWAYCSYSGKPFFRESEQLAEVRQTFEEFSKILVDYESNNIFSRDPLLADKVIEFYNRVVKEDAFVRTSKTLTPTEHVRWSTLLVQIRHWYFAAKISKQTQKPRQVPLWINLVGPPGIGKTTAVNTLASGIFNVTQKGEARDFLVSDRFERKVENEFWDGYKSQWVTTYDDLYQVVDPTLRMTTTMELIHAVNSNSYPLHMAEIGDKQGTYFASKLIISTSNVEEFPTDIGISAPEALRRRCHIPVKMEKTPAFGPITESHEALRGWQFRVKTALGSSDDAFERPLTSEEFISYCVYRYKILEAEAETILNPPTKEFWETTKISDDFTKLGLQRKEAQPLKLVDNKTQVNKVPVKDGWGHNKTIPFNKKTMKYVPKVVKSDVKTSVIQDNKEVKVEVKQMSNEEKWEASWNSKTGDIEKDVKGQMQPSDDDSYDSYDDEYEPDEKVRKIVNNLDHNRETLARSLATRLNVTEVKTLWDWIVWPKSVHVGTIEFDSFKSFHSDMSEQEMDDVVNYIDEQAGFTFSNPLYSSGELLKTKYYVYQMRKDRVGLLAHFSDLSMYQSAEKHCDLETMTLADHLTNVPQILKEIRHRKFTNTITLDLYKSSTVKRALIAMRLFKRHSDSDYLTDLFFPSEITEFERTVTALTGKGYYFPNAVDFGNYAVSPDHAAMALFTRVFNEGKNNWTSIVDVAFERYKTWKKGAMFTAVGLAVGTAATLLLLKTWMAGIDAVTGQSYDKGNVSRDKMIRRRARYNKSKVTLVPRIAKRDKKDSKARRGKHKQKVGGKKGGLWGGKISYDTSDTVMNYRGEYYDSDEDDLPYEVDGQYGTEEVTRLANMFMMNSVEAEITFENNTTVVVMLFFVKGKIAFTVKHAFSAGKVKYISLHARVGEQGSRAYSAKQFDVHLFQDRDLARIVFHNERPYKDLSGHLRPFNTGDIIQYPSRLEWDLYKDTEYRVFVRGTRAKACEGKKATIITKNGKKLSFINSWWYVVENCEGYEGACAYPYMDANPSSPKRLLGIHIGAIDDTSMVAPIFESDLDIGDDEKSFLAQVGFEECPIKTEEYVMRPIKCPEDSRYAGFEAFNHVKKIDGVRFEVTPKSKPYLPDKSAIIPSPIQMGIKEVVNGKIVDWPCPYEVTKAPACLGVKEGETPLQKAMDKYGEIVAPPIPDDILAILDDPRIYKGICSEETRLKPRRKLTMEEAVLGVPDLGIKPMDLGTSLGYPFTINGQKTDQHIKVQILYKGKWVDRTPHLEKMTRASTRVWFSRDFLNEYERHIQCYKEGKIPYYIVNDTLKDELRDIDRVKARKTRLFDVGNKVTVLILKQYFGMLYADIERDRMISDIKVGINVHSHEWEQEFMRQAAMLKNPKDPGVMAGDFERWDKTMMLLICSKLDLWEVNNIGYQLEDWERKMLLMAGMAAHSALHNNPAGMYQVDQGQSSGHYKTTVRNCEYNSVLHRVVYAVNAPIEERWTFDDNVRLGVFGDDAHSTVKEKARKWFNMEIMKETVSKYFGMGYTDSNKGDVNKPFMTFDESTFLKRRFYQYEKDGQIHVLPQLERTSIENSILWMEEKRSEQMKLEALRQCAESAMMEWFYYGEKEYQKNMDIIVPRIRIILRNRFAENKDFYVLPFADRWSKWCLEKNLQ